jgi:hypothetical protein
MSDRTDTEEKEREDVEAVEVTEERERERTEPREEVVLDFESAEEYQTRIDELQREVENQREQIAELQSLLLDLSTRVADGGGMGVCPECHGPVEKTRRWFGSTTIECRRCGELFHEY